MGKKLSCNCIIIVKIYGPDTRHNSIHLRSNFNFKSGKNQVENNVQDRLQKRRVASNHPILHKLHIRSSCSFELSAPESRVHSQDQAISVIYLFCSANNNKNLITQFIAIERKPSDRKAHGRRLLISHSISPWLG